MAKHRMARQDPLVVAAWELSNGWLDARTLPQLANEAYARGADSPSLAELAGAHEWEVRDNANLLNKALREMGVPAVEGEENEWLFVRHYCAELVDDPTKVAVNTRRLADIAVGTRVDRNGGDLRIFSALANELDDEPEGSAALSSRIVASAQELLDRGGPRRWIRLTEDVDGYCFVESGHYGWHHATDVPLPSSFVDRVTEWNAAFVDRTPTGAREAEWRSQAEAQEFRAAGQALADEMAAVLGPKWNVEYYGIATDPPGLRLRPSLLRRIRRRLGREK